MLTEQTLKRLWPRARPELIAAIVEQAPTVLPRYGLDSPLVLAHFMAQCSWECNADQEGVENLNYTHAETIVRTWPTRFNVASAAAYVRNPKALANAVYNGRMGNRPGTDDGYVFRGRGGTQVTGRSAYAQLNAVNTPEVVNDPAKWLEYACQDYIDCGCLQYAKADDIEHETRALNGGLNGLAGRKVWLERWKTALALDGHAVPGAQPPAPEDALTPEEIKAVQQKLRDLGYFEVGTVDGIWGSRTTAAISALQHDNAISVTGHFDTVTRTTLSSAEARRQDPARRDATESDLRGSRTIEGTTKLGWWAKLKLFFGSLLAGGGGIAQTGLFDSASDAIDQGQKLSDKLNQARTVMGSVHDVLAPILKNEGVIWFGLILIASGLFVYIIARKIAAARLDDHQTGIHAGGG
jgi:putative chitinase